MSKEALSQARREHQPLNMADIIQIERRNNEITPDIRQLIMAGPPGSRGWSAAPKDKLPEGASQRRIGG